MDASFSKSILTKLGVAILAIALIDLFYLNYWVLKSDKLALGNGGVEDNRVITVNASPTPTPTPNDLVRATPAASPVPASAPMLANQTVETKTVIQTAQKEIFIPLGSGSTKSGTFEDLSGLEVTIDTTKYSQIDLIVFEASLWTDGGNGRAWAKLKNITDSNPFIESQISATSSTGEVKTSGTIPIPTGSKKYGVQAKTDIVNFAAHVDNARIKIVLK